MATHDYIISNASGAAVRADLNNALAAIATNNSSATEPTTTYAYQWWADTGSSPTVMKLRNAANSAWITLFQLDGEWTVVPFENGTAAAPSIYFKDSGTDTGIYSPGTDQVGISAGGTSRFEVSTSATTSTLPVVHPLGAVGTPSITFTGDLNTGIWSPAADTVAASTGGSERLRIDSSGRVGIGSTAPTNKLVVSDSGNGGFEVAPGATDIQTYSYNRGTSAYITHTDLASAFIWNNGTAERARIDSSGRLLVGTSSARNNLFGDSNIYSGFQLEGAGIVPANRFLSIVNNYDTSADGDPMLVLGRTRGSAVGGGTIVQSGDQLGAVSFQGSQGSSVFREAARIQAFVDGTPGANDMPGRLVFSVTRDGQASPTIGMSLLNTGEFRFGSTDQTKIGTDPVHTIGDVSLATVQTNLARLVMQERANNWISFKAGSGSHNGTISVSGAGVSYGSNSDYRLKENITSIEGAIQKLKLAKPCQYNFIAFPDQRIDGFIAHELQEVVPSAVNGQKDATDEHGNPEYQTVDASKLVPLLTAALQEAIAKIETLEAKVAALEAN